MRSLIAWNRNGDIVATLDHVVAKDADGHVVGLVDFEAHENAGGKMRDIWDVCQLDAPIPDNIAKTFGKNLPPDHPFRAEHETVTGSGTWPEWLGGAAHNFRVELINNKPVALVHRESGHRRERSAIEAAIADRIAQANGEPADIRDIVGGPNKPLILDDKGKTRPRQKIEPSKLPVISARADHP